MLQATTAIADFMLILISASLWVAAGIAGAAALAVAGATALVLAVRRARR